MSHKPNKPEPDVLARAVELRKCMASRWAGHPCTSCLSAVNALEAEVRRLRAKLLSCSERRQGPRSDNGLPESTPAEGPPRPPPTSTPSNGTLRRSG
jgi:hypothetical protein